MPPDNGPGREFIHPGNLRPNLVEYIAYDTTDLLQAEGHIVLACCADLETNSAALRFVLRECGRKQIFYLHPEVGEVRTLILSVTNKPSQAIHSMITRANQIADTLPALSCEANAVVPRQGSDQHSLSNTGPRKASVLFGQPISDNDGSVRRNQH